MNIDNSITFKETLSRSEVDQLLDELLRERVKIQPPSGEEFIITDIENEKIFIDLKKSPKYFESALKLELRLNKIKYEFETQVKAHKDKFYLIKPNSIVKYQRRENYRTSIPKNMTISLKTWVNDSEVNNVRVINISLTGALFAIKDCDNLDFQDHFSAEIHYDNQKFRIEGDIVRIDLQSEELFFAIKYNTKMAAQKAALHQFLLHCFRLSKSVT
ncbi:MAG: PilZ domain-containing protein [Bdellovibrionales bacterium]|nr:PilZ domain-containing protein [Bdellovibrionales bacterium]